ncbi:39s ribosomal protein mitochondrial precursor, partial [Cystoisospora suis]
MMRMNGGLLSAARGALWQLSTRRGIATTPPRRGIEELWKGGYLDPSIGAKEKEKNAIAGDAWPACLLRLKSFEDLHALWYLCLKEKNLLLGERWAARQHKADMKNPERLQKKKREALETQRFHLEEKILQMTHKLNRLQQHQQRPENSLMKEAWRKTLEKYTRDHEDLLIQLHPLRK